jgi:hypothetical protein
MSEVQVYRTEHGAASPAGPLEIAARFRQAKWKSGHGKSPSCAKCNWVRAGANSPSASTHTEVPSPPL